MKAFVAVSLFFIVFSGVVGGALFLTLNAVKSMHLPEDTEHACVAIAGVAALIVGGLLMRQLHAMIERRL